MSDRRRVTGIRLSQIQMMGRSVDIKTINPSRISAHYSGGKILHPSGWPRVQMPVSKHPFPLSIFEHLRENNIACLAKIKSIQIRGPILAEHLRIISIKLICRTKCLNTSFYVGLGEVRVDTVDPKEVVVLSKRGAALGPLCAVIRDDFSAFLDISIVKKARIQLTPSKAAFIIYMNAMMCS